MRNHVKKLIGVPTVLVAIASIALAQAPKVTGTGPGKFDPHDLTGVWQRQGDRGINPIVPEMTPEGLKRFNANKPSYGRPLGAPLNGEHIGRVRAVPPAGGNSLIGDCNPPGVPRLYFEPEPVEFIQAPGRLLQFFSWTRALREIWTDGRNFPDDVDALMPTWYGYNIGKWEEDTFVVDSLGYDERSWLDHFGYPHSAQMRMQERFRRVSTDTIEMVLTINDPLIYKTPWVSQKNTFKLVPREDLTLNGWYGFLEGICAPIDEGDFNKRLRDPAGGVTR